MEYIILFICFILIFWFAHFFTEQNQLNIENIRLTQPPSVYTVPDIEVFNYYVKMSKLSNEEAWQSIISLGLNCQTLENFLETGKIDYRLKGIMISLLLDISYRK